MDFQFDIIIAPFLTVLMFFWFAFCLVLIFKPFAWHNMQNKYSRAYGFQWTITDEKKFVSIHRRAGILLLIFGLLFVIILIAKLIII